MVQVWHAQLLAHRGEAELAADVAQRGLLDPHLPHPFVSGHGRFTLAYALGMTGAWNAALEAVDDLDELIARTEDKRFPPVAANVRGWLLRGAGLLEEAIELHCPAVEVAPGPTFQEAHYAALLDLAECHLANGDHAEAGGAMDRAADVLDWTGSMSWRHRNRYQLLSSRMTALGGNPSAGSSGARFVAEDAVERGDQRYERRALLTALTIEARAGGHVEPDALATVVKRFLPLSGPDGWRDLGELARATGSDEVWRVAEHHASGIVAAASHRSDLDADRVAKAVRRQLDRLKP
jgi:tetratricopeptide (TPR) repeat protein